MKLQIDNLDGAGVRDYTAAVDAARPARIVRRLNRAAELQCSLVANAPSFVTPANGARIVLTGNGAQNIFTGYLTQAPALEYLGWGERGAVYRYGLIGLSDEVLLDRKRLPSRAPFVARSAGSALRQLDQDLLPSAFDTSGVQDLDVLPSYLPDPQKKWSQHAAEIALQARAVYRTMNGAMTLAAAGATVYALNETDGDFSPEGLQLQPVDDLINDVTVIGDIEPQAYVKDYFVGDGLSLKFYLSQTPFSRFSRTLVNEEYSGGALDSTRWSAADPALVVMVSGGRLQVTGGTGVDGQTTVTFADSIELSGAMVLQHGDMTFSAASNGVLGGLYPGSITRGGCLAGFQVTPNGAQSDIQALVNGVASGPVVTTVAGHHYVLTTRLYSLQIYRRQQTYHSAAHPAGSGRGGANVSADVRVVLEVHDIDPTTPATLVAPSVVLYDGVIPGAPGYCTYGLVNASSMQCAIAFTRMIQAADTEVRSALPGESPRTRLVGALSDGAECNIASGPALDFFAAYVPASNELISVRYRGNGRGLARVTNPASIAAQQHGSDDGVRSVLRHVKNPPARTAVDCENAALAILDDAAGAAWLGQYETWSDFLPGNAADIFPGDALQVNAVTRAATFVAAVYEVDITVNDLEGDHNAYKIMFATDAAKTLAFEFEASGVRSFVDVPAMANTQVGTVFLPDLTAAEITAVTSTTVAIDAGSAPVAGGGIEVRWSDTGWGAANDRNLVGRFAVQSFVIPRLSRAQSCFLRQYDASVPPKYSRYSAALHVDYPYPS